MNFSFFLGLKTIKLQDWWISAPSVQHITFRSVKLEQGVQLENSFSGNVGKIPWKTSAVKSFEVKNNSATNVFMRLFVEIFGIATLCNICEEQPPQLKTFTEITNKSYGFFKSRMYQKRLWWFHSWFSNSRVLVF